MIVWDDFTATMIAEGEWELAGVPEEHQTEQTKIEAYQYMADTGLPDRLQGRFGRTIQRLADLGLVQTENQSADFDDFELLCA